MTLDKFFWEEYNGYLNRIAGALGYSMDQLLTIAVYKYNFRLGQGKSQKISVSKTISLQKYLPKSALTANRCSGPNGDAIPKTFHTLAEVQTMFNTRLEQLRQEHAWKKSGMIKGW